MLQLHEFYSFSYDDCVACFFGIFTSEIVNCFEFVMVKNFIILFSLLLLLLNVLFFLSLSLLCFCCCCCCVESLYQIIKFNYQSMSWHYFHLITQNLMPFVCESLTRNYLKYIALSERQRVEVLCLH